MSNQVWLAELLLSEQVEMLLSLLVLDQSY